MANQSKISKMFGALVLGGCIHQSTPADSTQTASNPAEKSEAKSEVSEVKSEVKNPEQGIEPAPREPDATKQAAPEDHCQLEFNLNRYKQFNTMEGGDENSVERIRTCLDEITVEEILKIIQDAKAQTCKTPFCGCWLG